MFNQRKNVNLKTIKFGFLGGAAEVFYVLLVAFVLTSFEKNMVAPPAGIWGPMMILLIFVFSAGISGGLVFGYPAYLALQKKFIDAVIAALAALFTLALVGFLIFILAALV